jgi:hypothetical protein
VTFELESVAVAIDAKSAAWRGLGMMWLHKPVSPNFGKPVVAGEFESATWLGGLAVSISGEAELVTVQVADGWNVNKHYELRSLSDLCVALAGRKDPTSRPSTDISGVAI